MFLAPLPEALSVRYYQPDERSPGDLDCAAQQVAGLLVDGRMWQLSVADAAHLVEKGRVTMAIDAAVAGTGLSVPPHVARSARGRRFGRVPEIGSGRTSSRGSRLHAEALISLRQRRGDDPTARASEPSCRASS
ncbi:MAG: hypothetical protein ACRD1K_06840 [Acidimicrobiales bacterium]